VTDSTKPARRGRQMREQCDGASVVPISARKPPASIARVSSRETGGVPRYRRSVIVGFRILPAARAGTLQLLECIVLSAVSAHAMHMDHDSRGLTIESSSAARERELHWNRVDEERAL
jgi:hypothetical protein